MKSYEIDVRDVDLKRLLGRGRVLGKGDRGTLTTSKSQRLYHAHLFASGSHDAHLPELQVGQDGVGLRGGHLLAPNAFEDHWDHHAAHFQLGGRREKRLAQRVT